MGSVPWVANQPADFSAFLLNSSGRTVVLRSARLVPLHGFRAPRLAYVAIEMGKDFVASDRGYLRPGRPGSRIPIAAFAGHRIANRSRATILYGVVATRQGNYAADGLRVEVSSGGSVGSVFVSGRSAFCVVPHLGID